MTATVQASQVIDRPVATVFHFYSDEHVQNHPRWDPDIYLEKEVDAPLAVGSRLRRRNSRSGTPVEGSMQVVEFERDRAIAMLIQDGPVAMNGRATFEALGPEKTLLSVTIDIPSRDPSADMSFLNGRLQRTLENIKQLVESEL